MFKAWALEPKQYISHSRGFTIVELLIVVVVIAILAAITIVAFTGIQDRARTAALQSSAAQASRKLATYSVTNNETFPTNKANFLSVTGLSESSSLVYNYQVTSDAKNYCVSASDPTRPSQVGRAQTNASTPEATGACVRNIAKNTRGVSGATSPVEYGTRYSGAPSWPTGASDGPLPAITTYARQTINTAVTGSGRGFDFNVNLDVTPGGTNFNWPVTSGQPVTVSVYLRASIANTSTILRCRTYSGTAWVGLQTQSATVNAAANQWNRLSLTHTSSADGYLACTARPDASTSWTVGSTIDATGLMVTEGATLYDFADGLSGSWAWDGASGLSQSIGPVVAN